MTDPLPLDRPTPSPPPVARMTEADVIAVLRQRYTKVSMGAHRYAFADHVPSEPLFGARIADFIAVDCWRGSYQTEGYPIHGHEIKVSRSDWLAELRQPDKAEAFKPYCDYWWLVVPDKNIARDGVPDGWGLMVVTRGTARAVRRAPKRTPLPMPRAMQVSLLRAVGKTSRSLADPPPRKEG